MRQARRWAGRSRPFEAIGGLALFESHRAAVVAFEAQAGVRAPAFLRSPRRRSRAPVRDCDDRAAWLAAVLAHDWGGFRLVGAVAARLVRELARRFASCVSGRFTFDAWASPAACRDTCRRLVGELERAGFLRVTRFRLIRRPDPRYPANLYRLTLPIPSAQLSLENASVQDNQHVDSEVWLEKEGRDLPVSKPAGEGHGLASRTEENPAEWAPDLPGADPPELRPVDVVLARIAELRAARGSR